MITINTIELLFAYEDGYCYKYRSYDKAAEKDDEVYLCGYIHNLYYNCTEKLAEIRLRKRPTLSEIKEFMRECKAMIRDAEEERKREEELRRRIDAIRTKKQML